MSIHSNMSLIAGGTALHAVAIVSVFAVGIIAGQMLAIAIANYAVLGLPETSWTLRFQSENDLFTKTMPPFLIAPTIGLAALFFLTHEDARAMFAAAAVGNRSHSHADLARASKASRHSRRARAGTGSGATTGEPVG